MCGSVLIGLWRAARLGSPQHERCAMDGLFAMGGLHGLTQPSIWLAHVRAAVLDSLLRERPSASEKSIGAQKLVSSGLALLGGERERNGEGRAGASRTCNMDGATEHVAEIARDG